MSFEMEKIIEISLAKVEKSKAKKVGKSGLLHRSLLVNTLLNRVRSTEKTYLMKEPLMNYREPKSLIDLDLDEFEMDRVPSVKDTRSIFHQQQTQPRKKSSLVTKLNTRSVSGKIDISANEELPQHDDTYDMKENKTEDIHCECSKLKTLVSSLNKQGKKRNHSTELVEDECPSKKLRCIWPSNTPQMDKEMGYSVTSLASLFGGLVANTTDSEMSNIRFRNKLVSSMVAC